MTTTQRYLRPSRMDVLFGKAMNGMSRMGISLFGSRELRVRGRVSGEMRSTAVNLLTYEGKQYLVSARGNSQWVRNLRAAGTGELRRGNAVQLFTAVELTDQDKIPVLRAYLKRWAFEVKRFFDGIDGNASDEQLSTAAPGCPIFLITSE